MVTSRVLRRIAPDLALAMTADPRRCAVLLCGRTDDPLVEVARLRLAADSFLVTEVATGRSGAEQVRALQAAVLNVQSDFVTIVRSGELVLPGAVRQLCDALRHDDAIGMVHGRWFPVDARGATTRQAMRDRNKARDELSFLQALPTFRRDTLLSHGGFRGRTLEAALERAARYAVGPGAPWLLPHPVCGRFPGTDGKVQPSLSRRVGRAIAYLHASLTARRRVSLTKLRRSLARMLGPGPVSRFVLGAPRPYQLLHQLLRRLPAPLPSASGVSASGGECIAYVLWRYPILSETFIRREVEALHRWGANLVVLALEPDDTPCPLDAVVSHRPVRYYGSGSVERGLAFIWKGFWSRPVVTLGALAFVARHRNRPDKLWARDREVLGEVGRLASELRAAGATHVHSPWATHTATVSLLAARLLGLPFSVQARASDVHRKVDSVALPDRVMYADFVITNSAYNERALHQAVEGRLLPPLHIIYDTVEASIPRGSVTSAAGTIPHLVSIARLVETKGLSILMRALHQLREEGAQFTCEIIGGPDLVSYPAAVVELHWLHASLGLEDVVSLRGPLSHAQSRDALRWADVFVLPCVEARDGTRDITPNSILEAMAIGLPVISTTVGAIPELVEHGTSGILVAPGDVGALARAIRSLLEDPILRSTIGEKARHRIYERFDSRTGCETRAALFRSC
ncbi:MAG: glycosyl transferase group 1 [Gemmatimonadetes bacterium]|nr:glycosyl transferase group 1 [Gemmatimonadota bacterium]